MDTLFDVNDLPRDATPRQRFEAFHKRNPHVYDQLETMAAAMVARGRQRIGIKMLVEVLRWNYYMRTDDPNSSYKIDNNFTSRYARLILERHPEWEGLFALREVHEEPTMLIRTRAS